MKEKKLIITVWVAGSDKELPEEDRQLIEEAYKATKQAYSPYSKFNVGVAVVLENGVVIQGSNQENTAFPSGLCAERVAIFYANSQYPDIAIKTMAITSLSNGKQNNKAVYPCGACRQSMIQSEMRQQKPIRVIMAGSEDIQIVDSIKSLLPLTFDLEDYR
ncbi:MAG: cytidine deaminase [Prevotellaceae bacterium]|jgi:cytidine deaminase|nr:cytidine deaminase [Prevotellaceae bacterium]